MTHKVDWEQRAGNDIAAGCSLRFVPCMAEPERIVALGFRYWMLGLSTGDVGAWEQAWSLYSGKFGVKHARDVVACLSRWVGAVGACARRDIEVFPERCNSFCRDECIAVSLVAACQHRTIAAAEAAACALLDTSATGRVVASAGAFAAALSVLEHRLQPDSILVTPACARAAAVPLQ